MSASPRAAGDWPSVIALALTQLVAYGALYYVYTPLLEPMEADLGVSRLESGLAFSIGLAAQALAARAVGRHVDRGGARGLMAAGTVASAFLLALWSQVGAAWQLYLVWAAIGATSAAVLYEAAFASLARRFGADYRRAVTTVTLIAGFSGTVFVPATQALEDAYGWRGAVLALAAVHLGLGLALHLGLAHRGAAAPTPMTPKPAALGVDPRRRAVLTLLATSYAAYAAMGVALVLQLFPLLGTRGLEPAAAALAVACIGPAQVLGRLIVVALPGAADTRRMGVAACAAPALAIALLAVDLAGPASPYLFAIVFGLGYGVHTIVKATAAAELLGREGYGAMQGALTAPALVAQALAPLASAAAWTLGGADALLAATLAAALVSLVAFLAALRAADQPMRSATSA